MTIKPDDLPRLQKLLEEGGALVKGADRWRALMDAPRPTNGFGQINVEIGFVPSHHSGGETKRANFRVDLASQEPESKPARTRLLAWALLGRMLLEADEYRRREIVGELHAAGVEVPEYLRKPL